MSASTRTDPVRREDHLDLAGLARIPVQSAEPIRCRHCHSSAPERLFRLVGAWSVIDGDPVWDCDRCTREHLFEIEAGSASTRRTAGQLLG